MRANKRWIAVAMAATLGVLASGISLAGDEPAVTAGRVHTLAAEAAAAWADDARLIYLENDEAVGLSGTASRWGYLYYSPSRDIARSYSVEGAKVRQAVNLDFDFPAPPLAPEWIDSDRAFTAAEDAGGRKYREKNAGRLRSMLLMRRAFHEKKPDRTTWTLIYDSSSAPSYWIVIDAESGDVVRTWKG